MKWIFGAVLVVLLLPLAQRTGAQDPGTELALMMAKEQQRQICVLQDRILRLEEKLYPNPAKEVDKIRMCNGTP